MTLVSVDKILYEIYRTILDFHQSLSSVYEICYPTFNEWLQGALETEMTTTCREYAIYLINTKYWLTFEYYPSSNLLIIPIEVGPYKKRLEFRGVTPTVLINLITRLYPELSPGKVRTVVQRELELIDYLPEPRIYTFNSFIK